MSFSAARCVEGPRLGMNQDSEGTCYIRSKSITSRNVEGWPLTKQRLRQIRHSNPPRRPVPRAGPASLPRRIEGRQTSVGFEIQPDNEWPVRVRAACLKLVASDTIWSVAECYAGARLLFNAVSKAAGKIIVDLTCSSFFLQQPDSHGKGLECNLNSSPLAFSYFMCPQHAKRSSASS